MLGNDFILWYLFLGSLGGGTFASAFAIRLLARRCRKEWAALSRAVWVPALAVSGTALVLGTVCLLKDLAAAEDALLLFTKPTWSAISVGAFSLAGLIGCVVLLLVEALQDRAHPHSHPHPRRKLFYAVEWAGIVLALVVVVYTGVLLEGIAAVPLWSTPALPVLFLLSSLSVGIAVAVLIAGIVQPQPRALEAASLKLLRADAVLVVLEAAALVAMVVHLQGSAIAVFSIEMLVSGAYAGQFWVGFIACGLMIPLGVEAVLLVRKKAAPLTLCFMGASVVVGGFFLRYCLMQAGLHSSLFMFAGL